MHVWITPQLNELLQITQLPLRLEPRDRIKELFLSQAAPQDIAIVIIDDNYMTFLAAARDQGMGGPILLVSPEPTIVAGDLHRFNALVLDMKRMGSGEVRNIIQVILKLAEQRRGPDPGGPSGEQPAETKADEPNINDVLAIQHRLDYLRKKDLPVIVAFEIREKGEMVTARGFSSIKEVRNDAVVLHRFKQGQLLKGMKKDMSVTIYFNYKNKNHGSRVVIQQATDRELTISVPSRLFITREMRIQPNPGKPIGLYANIPNEPTTQFQVMDISTRGIGFLCSRELPIDGVYSLTIMLPDPQAVVVTSGTIRYKKEGGNGIRYGAEITTHPWDEENIARYVMKREAEIVGLLRNL